MRAVGLLVVLLGHQQHVAVGEGRLAPRLEVVGVGTERVVVDEVVVALVRSGRVPRPARPGRGDQARLAGVRGVPHGRAAAAGVGADAGGVEVPLVAGGRASGTAGRPSVARVAVDLPRPLEVAQVEDREAAVAVAGGVGVPAVGLVDAGDGVGAGRAGRACRRSSGAAGSVTSTTPSSPPPDVDVLGLGRARPGTGRPRPGRSAGCRRGTPLAAVHRLVLEHGVGQDADRGRVGGVADVPHPDRLDAAGDEDGAGPQEAAGDRRPSRAGREVLDVAAEQRGVVALGEEGVRGPRRRSRSPWADGRGGEGQGAADGRDRRRQGRRGCACTLNDRRRRRSRVRATAVRPAASPASSRTRGRGASAACAAASASFSCVRRRTSASSSATRARSRVFSAESRAGIRRSLFM